MTLPTVRTVDTLRTVISAWRRDGLTVALVPTMGALHNGHLALAEEGMRQADRVVVSVFVNPIQFGLEEDQIRYPRQEAMDRAKLASVGTHLLFAPTEQEMYPAGFSTKVTVIGMTDWLCGAYRPVHFSGVATVVTKLILQSLPDVALFGEKDYQQLQLIKRLVTDLNMPVRVVGVPIVRATDGLALSSRNSYLSAEERGRAAALYQALCGVVTEVANGVDPNIATNIAQQQILAAGFNTVDYLVVCDSDTMTPLAAPIRRPARVIAAAWLGRTRLIDNVAIPPARYGMETEMME